MPRCRPLMGRLGHIPARCHRGSQEAAYGVTCRWPLTPHPLLVEPSLWDTWEPQRWPLRASAPPETAGHLRSHRTRSPRCQESQASLLILEVW